MREACLAEFDAHWQCLEKNNQVGPILLKVLATKTHVAVLPGLPQAGEGPQRLRVLEIGAFLPLLASLNVEPQEDDSWVSRGTGSGAREEVAHIH